jgi:hypothetical protein
MPTISTFYGIVIMMYLKDKEHNPPHIHAFYNDSVGVFDITTGELIHGEFPKTARKLVKKFISDYRNELLDMWNNATYRKLKWID